VLKIRLLAVVLALIVSVPLFASNILGKWLKQYDQGQLTSDFLQLKLTQFVSNSHRPPSGWTYKKARLALFGKLHLERDQQGLKIKDTYCKIIFRSNIGIGKGKIPNHHKLNCEHTWPQSRFTKNFSKKLQKNDLHHLYPVHSRTNSSRSNIQFGEVETDDATTCLASKRGEATNSYATVFEPPSEHKGNVARALFYFSIRYKLSIDDTEEEFLREWHKLDPVDAKELARNKKIRDIQGNLNPFISKPALVDIIENF